MKDLAGDKIPKEYKKTGWYFSINNLVHYFVELKSNKDNNVDFQIYELSTPQEKIKSKSSVIVPIFDIELIITLDMWAKYYNVEYKRSYNQFHYDISQVSSQAAVLNFAIKIGKELIEIY